MKARFDLDPRSLVSSLCVNHEKRYVFVDNPKSASSTIKRELWDIEVSEGRQDREAVSTDIHGGGFLKTKFGREIEDYFTFAVVRNPYARLLSAYLDKVQGGRPPAFAFIRQAGLPSGSEISFSDFVKGVAAVPSNLSDRHWAAQIDNLLQGAIGIEHVASVENIGELLDLFRTRLGSQRVRPERSNHSTGASKKLLEYYDEETQEIVWEHYRDDFEIFGYPRELERSAEPPSLDGKPLEVDPERNELAWAYLLYWRQRGSKKKLQAGRANPETSIFATSALAFRGGLRPPSAIEDDEHPLVMIGWLKNLLKRRRHGQAETLADRLLVLVPHSREVVVAKAATVKARGVSDEDNPFIEEALSMTWHVGRKTAKKRIDTMANEPGGIFADGFSFKRLARAVITRARLLLEMLGQRGQA